MPWPRQVARTAVRGYPAAMLRPAAALACLCLWATGSPDAPAAVATHPQDPQAARPAAAADCGRCHQAIHDEWRASAHGRAFTDPVYQAALKGRARPELCHGCHIPQNVLDRLGQKPRPRADHHHDGVGCVACHARGEAIHGPFGAATDAHRSVKDPVFGDQGSTALCSSCHATAIADVLPLARDFAEAGLQAKGKSCVGCHMAAVERPLAVDPATGAAAGPARHGRSHALRGPGDPLFCAEAFALTVAAHGAGLRLRVRNKAGHRVPGLARLRAFVMRFRVVDGGGRTLHELPFTVDGDNPLLVGETRILDLPRPDGAVAVLATVHHRFGDTTRGGTQVLDERLEIR